MHLVQAIVAGLVILILILGFFAFHVLMRLYVWPETYRKEKEKENPTAEKIQKELKPPE